MLEDSVENMPMWAKGVIAIGTGIIVGIMTAKLLMMIGIGNG